MSKLLEGKFALVLGIANKWSLAYAIAQAYSREGATLVLDIPRGAPEGVHRRAFEGPRRGRRSSLRRHEGGRAGGAHRIAARPWAGRCTR